jgi:hypothetical protein
MAGEFSPANSMTINTGGNFIPEIWADEVIAAYKKNLVLANLVTRLNHNGKKGDTIHIPTPTRGAATAKAPSTAVTLITATEGIKDISINKHYEYSRLIEDLLDKQALQGMRAFYTDDAGYALAKQVDTHLFETFWLAQGGDGAATSFGDKAVIGSDGITLYAVGSNNHAALTDAGIRKVIQTLDDADVPMTERFLVVPPVEKKNLTGISRFTEQAFIGESGNANTIRTGLIGDLYGIPVYVSTNCPTETGANPDARMCVLAHRSAILLVEQMSVRTQTQYKQEFLADLFTADTIYGVGEIRDDAAVVIAVPA